MLWIACAGKGFAQVHEDFSDGDLTADPEWVGDLQDFKISFSSAIPQDHRPGLQLEAPAAGTSSLFTRAEVFENMEWEFWVKLSFNTSANNYARFFLLTDSLLSSLSRNSYYIQLGGIDDSLYLFRERDGLAELVMTGKSLFTGNSTNACFLKIILEAGAWNVFSDMGGTGMYAHEGSFNDPFMPEEGYFGLWFSFTGSNSSKFYFDELTIKKHEKDTLPPGIAAVKSPAQGMVTVSFTEKVTGITALSPLNYLLVKEGMHPDSTCWGIDAGESCLLFFPLEFVQGEEYLLKAGGPEDLAGNSMADTVVKFRFYKPLPYDIVINEIMADPVPSVGLPEYEYLELLNTSQFPVELNGWSILTGNSAKPMPDLAMGPGEIVIVCHEEAEWVLSGYGKTIALSSFSLPNSGQTLNILDEQGKNMFFLEYDDSWYGDPDKGEGGWSLEQIDPEFPCTGKLNWHASKAAEGGTPGQPNSALASNPSLPVITKCCPINNSMIEVFFSVNMDSLSLADATLFSINQGIGHPSASIPVPPSFRSTVLMLENLLDAGFEYRLSLGPAADCKGMTAEEEKEFFFGMPTPPGLYQVVINEILFDPIGDGEDYIELYNRGGNYVDLGRLFLASVTGNPPQPPDTVSKRISQGCFLLAPGSYTVLTGDADAVCRDYHCAGEGSFAEMPSLPSLPNAETAVILQDEEGNRVDMVRYSEEMHFPLLANTDGVALEKIHYDLPGYDPASWQSASSLSGFGTPGYENSQFTDKPPACSPLSVFPEVVTPDGDGRDDAAVVSWDFGESGWTGTITVCSLSGHTVKVLINNELLGSSGSVSWNGSDGAGNIMPAGIFTIVLEAFHETGKTERHLVPCGILR